MCVSIPGRTEIWGFKEIKIIKSQADLIRNSVQVSSVSRN